MSKLNIKLRVSPITQLAQDSDGKYSFVVEFTNVDGSPLNSDKIQNSTSISAKTFLDNGVNKILLPINIAEGEYSIPVNINVYNKDKKDLLVQWKDYVIDTKEGGSYFPVPVVGIQNGKRIYNVGEYWYEIVNSKYVSFVVLPTGNVRVVEPVGQRTFNGKYEVNQVVVDDLWGDMQEDTPDQLAALRSEQGIDIPEGETLTYLSYPVRKDWGNSLQTIQDGDNIRIWYAYGNNDTSNESTYFRNNSGEPHQASVYKYKLSK